MDRTIAHSPVGDEAMVEFLLRYLAVSSPSTEEGQAATVLADEMRRLGFEVVVDDWGNVVGTLRLGWGPTVLVDCHLDTVGVTDPSAWTRSPSGEIADGRVYGRGAMDMKGPTAAVLHGLASLAGGSVGTVVVSGTVAEELVEGPALVHVCEAVRPDFVVVAESTDLRVNHGQRGRAEIEVSVFGRSSHSAHPEAGVNAAEVMADVIVAMRGMDAPTDPHLGTGIQALTDVMSNPYPGLSVLPDRCTATYDRRLLVGETADEVLEPIRALVDEVAARYSAAGDVRIATDDYRTYTGIPVTCPNFAPAWFTDPAAAVVAAPVAALRAAGLPHELGVYGFCTNASGSAGTLGIPSLGYGPGEEDQAHTVDESVALADLSVAARGYRAVVSALLALDPSQASADHVLVQSNS